MHLIVVLLVVMAFPLACLGFLLWMAHLEDTLPTAVRRTALQPDPPPILAVPVRGAAPVAPVIPAQRTGPSELPAVPPPTTLPPAAPATPAAPAGT